MNKEHWERLQTLFANASQLPTDEQLPYLKANAAGDEELISAVARMLENDAKASFLDREIGSIATEVLDQPEWLPLENIGPYRLIHKLGAGGMGVVYLAEREDWQSKVAVKVPRDIWISSDRVKRFADEQRLLAQLVHPLIARIYEGGTLANGTPWFAMEYVQGEPITRYCHAGGHSIRQRLQLFVSVCDAVQYAHTQAIIHRDLKPSNILITPSGSVKLLDFGIAKQLGDAGRSTETTRLGQHPVTLAYAAPEQVLLNRISTQTDVYSLGIILYELLTGSLPFDLSDLTPSQAEEIIRTKEPDKPSTAARQRKEQNAGEDSGPNPSRSEWADLNVLILIAMHRDLVKRYGSVDALKRDIVHYLNCEPLEARGDTLPYRLSKFVQRRRTPILVSVAALALLISLIGYYTISLAKARDAAVAEAARTRLARQFTESILEGDDQEVGPSKDLRVIDLLDSALKKAERLKGDPIQLGQMYTTLGSIFSSLGEYRKADIALHSAYRVLSSADPKGHEIAETLIDLGLMYSAEGQDEHAVTCIRKGLAIEEQIVPADTSLIYKYKTAEANVLVQGHPRAAIAILTQLLNEPASVADDEKRSDVWDLLATGYINAGDYAKAEPFARRVLAYSRRTRPAIHPDISSELINLALIQHHLRKYRDAEKSYREALAIDEAWFPKYNPEAGDIKRFLAETLFDEGRFDEAQVFARQALADEEKAYGNTHRRVAYALQLLGRLELKRGDSAEAEADLKREVAILRAKQDDANLPNALTYLGDAYMQQKSYKQAEGAYREAIVLFPQSPTDNTHYQAQANRKLGEALLSQKRYGDAEGPLLASYSVWLVKPAYYAEELSMTRRDLVRVYKGLKEPVKPEYLQAQDKR